MSYSLPLGTHGFSKESLVDAQGQVQRDFPRLQFGGAHLADPARDWATDVLLRAGVGVAGGVLAAAGARPWPTWRPIAPSTRCAPSC